MFENEADRFWSKVEFTDSCWLWTAGSERSNHGYGSFRSGTKKVGAHRWAYEFCVGPPPDGLELDHLCRVRHCVNPDHLEPVPHKINALRGFGLPAKNAKKEVCIRGHADWGTRHSGKRAGRRFCRTCQNGAYRQYYHRKKRYADTPTEAVARAIVSVSEGAAS